MSKVKIIANYLPQFHSIPENDRWWGKGYTDWVAVKKAEPLFPGHVQPNVPLNSNYYDLSEEKNIRWQAQLANQYGVYGFGIYHYWFNSELHLLERPSEILLSHPDIPVHYCFIWDNSTWKRTWSNVKFGNDWGTQNIDDNAENSSDGILAELIYGDEPDWKKHFNYCLPFFKDSRYIKIDNRPVFGVFSQDNGADILIKMFDFWDELAKKSGFDGIYVLGKHNHHNVHITGHEYEYEPLKHGWLRDSFCGKVYQKIRTGFLVKINRVDQYQYDTVWGKILRDAYKNKDKDIFYGAFAGYDDTPRRGRKGKVVAGGSPQKFEKYLRQLLQLSEQHGKEYVFLTAWNEWGEGAYLEPDEQNGYQYLEAVKRSVESL